MSTDALHSSKWLFSLIDVSSSKRRSPMHDEFLDKDWLSLGATELPLINIAAYRLLMLLLLEGGRIGGMNGWRRRMKHLAVACQQTFRRCERQPSWLQIRG